MLNDLQNILAPLAGERLQPLGHLSGTVYGAGNLRFQGICENA